MDDLWRLSAADLAALIASKKVSAKEAATAALARLDAVNPRINAVIDHRPADHFLVMSSAELGFVTGFNPTILSDDALLGYQSGHRADLIVMDDRMYGTHYQGFQQLRPEVADYIRALLEKCSLIYTDGYNKVYATARKSS